MLPTVNDHVQTPEIICFGEALVDRLGPLGGDFSDCYSTQDCLGGAPANVVCALAKLGIHVAFIGRLGSDAIGTDFKNLFVERDVDFSCLQIDPLLPSRVVLVCRDANGERSFGGFDGNKGNGFADEAINLEELCNQWPLIASNAQWLLVGTIPLAFPMSSQSLLWILKQAAHQGIRIALDVNWRPIFWDSSFLADSGPSQLARDAIQSVVELASLLKLSKEEAICFFNSSDPLEISHSLTNKPDVVITDGALPIKWLLNGFFGTMNVSSSLPIIDTTGAGDCFTAGLLSKIVSTRKLPTNHEEAEQMIRFAAACGALVCSGAGAITPQPSYEEVRSFMISGFGGKS